MSPQRKLSRATWNCLFLGLGKRNRRANMTVGRPDGLETQKNKFGPEVAVAVRTEKKGMGLKQWRQNGPNCAPQLPSH